MKEKMKMSDRPIDPSTVPALRTVEGISRFFDSRFRIPGTNIRFGLDPVLSLFPILGDLASYLVSGMLIHTMYRYGASRKVIVKMLINSTIDTVLGAIPLIGTIFDIFYRANDRNVRLLKEHYLEGKHQGSGTGLIVAIIALAILLMGLLMYAFYVVFQWIAGQFA